MPSASHKPFEAHKGPVVIVDADIGDALHAEEVIAALYPSLPVQLLTFGEDLTAYLQGEDLYKDRSRYPYPCLIVLDLKQPKTDGFRVLHWIRGHPEHGGVPIVALCDEARMTEHGSLAYQLGACHVLPKPVQQRDIQHTFTYLKISF